MSGIRLNELEGKEGDWAVVDVDVVVVAGVGGEEDKDKLTSPPCGFKGESVGWSLLLDVVVLMLLFPFAPWSTEPWLPCCGSSICKSPVLSAFN